MREEFGHFVLAAHLPHTGQETGYMHHVPSQELNSALECDFLGQQNFLDGPVLKSRDFTSAQSTFLVSHQR